MLHAFNGATGAEVFAYVPRGVQMAQLKELSARSYTHRYFVDGPITVSDRNMTRTATYPNGRIRPRSPQPTSSSTSRVTRTWAW